MPLKPLKETLKDLALNDEVASREDARTGLPRAERRRLAREKLLPKNRICPYCSKLKINSKQWIVTPDYGPVCISCNRTCLAYLRREGNSE